MTAVKIQGSFKKDDRPDNGLEGIAAKLLKDEHARFVVVGMVQFAKSLKERDAPQVPTVQFVGLEPLDDSDIDIILIRRILDRLRQNRGLRPLSDRLVGTLFDPDLADDEPCPTCGCRGHACALDCDCCPEHQPEPASNAEANQEDPPLEHEGATEGWGDELQEMKKDLGINPTVCAHCSIEIHYDGAAGIFLDDGGFPAGDGHQHEPKD